MSELPFSEDVERRCLSAMMLDPVDVTWSVCAGLADSDFYVPLHRLVFKALRECVADAQAVDAATIYRRMAGLNGDKPDFNEITRLEGLEPTSMRLRQLTADVMALARQRRILETLSEAESQVRQPAQNWEEIWSRVSPLVDRLGEIGVAGKTQDTAAMLSEAIASIENPLANALAGPFHSWDRDSIPLRAGQMAILAGRPGSGKTALALLYALHAAKTGRHVAIFSLEMAASELLERMARQTADDQTSSKVGVALRQLPVKTVHLFESSDHSSLAQIEARIRTLNAAYPLGLVVVDYLQLVRPGGTGRENREQQVSQISRSFKLLAGSLPCPLMVLCQLNRESEREGRKPRLSDLRESGAIEQDADAVWLLHEDSDGISPYATDRASVNLIQAKRRNGPANIFCRLSFHKPSFRFQTVKPGEET